MAEHWVVLFSGIQWREGRKRCDSENIYVYRMDTDVCIHCTFRDIGIIPGSTLVERQR
jgi:hypothetical protein